MAEPELSEGPKYPLEEFRSSARFPLHLPMLVLSNGERLEAETINISSGGVLFRLPLPSPVGSGLEFLLEIPEELFQAGASAAVHCLGHVIRSYEEDGFQYLAAVIDEYRFQ